METLGEEKQTLGEETEEAKREEAANKSPPTTTTAHSSSSSLLCRNHGQAEDDKELCSQLAIAESTYEEEDVNVDDEFNVVASSVVDIQERFNPPCSNLSCDWPSSGKKSSSLKVFVRQQQPLGCNNDGTAADRAWQIAFKKLLDRPRTPDASLRSSTATTASRTRTSMVQGASRAEVGLEKMMDFPRKKTKMESLSGHDQQHCRVLLWNRRFHDLASQCPLLIANDLSRMD